MVEPKLTLKKRKRASCKRRDLQSHHFQSPGQQPAIGPRPAYELPEQRAQLAPPPPTSWTARSRFFPHHEVDLGSFLFNPAFLCFYEEFVEAMTELYQAKPILIQEHVSADSWKVLVAVTLLNKTAGKKSIPVFFEIMNHWPTPAALAQAPLSLLKEMVKDLGLGEVRSARLVALSQTYISDPPLPGKLRPSRGKVYSNEEGSVPYPPTPVSHLPGCGPYALDSYRIFCVGGDEWKYVLPRDKELVKYLQWKWAIQEYRQWDPLHGPGDTIDLKYVRTMTAALTERPVSH